MKWFLITLGAMLPAILVSTALASPADQPAPGAESAAPQVIMLRSMDGSGGGGEDVVMEVRTEEGEDGDVIIHARGGANFAFAAGPADPNRGWLGVQLAPVPPVLAAHLKTAGGAGIMVGNVIKESPADQAGVQQYDVITAVNGKSVTGDVGKLAETIGGSAPGSKVSMKVLREGAESTLTVTLASRPAGDDMEWEYEFAPEAEINENIKTRGKIIRRGEDGKIVLEDLGDLQALKNLPDDIKAFIPKMGQFNTKFWTEDDNRSFSSSVSRDGVGITVKQDGDGPIQVERSDKDGNTTEATYADAAALEAADEEAHEIYQQAQYGAALESLHDGHAKAFSFFHPGAGAQGQGQWREEIEKAMREAREAVKGAHKTADQARKHFQFRFNKVPGHPLFSWNDEDGAGFFGAAPGRSFRVNPDGQIEVIIRKGENEVTKVFKDEADLAARDPELHEAFTATQVEDEE